MYRGDGAAVTKCTGNAGSHYDGDVEEYSSLESKDLGKPLAVGKGKMTFANGDVYQGHWKDGQRHGRGKLIEKASGDIYDGDWKMDEWYGKGRLTFSAGGYVEGSWITVEGDGMVHGVGVKV